MATKSTAVSRPGLLYGFVGSLQK